ncbi:NF041680 family putative transposase [Actinospica acidithermotolerans]|nr:NF041680 family putative transposase [Actinospica acidithermotolerans]
MVPCPGGQVQGNGTGGGPWLAALAGFRERVYGCLRRRADCLFELVDAVLCTQGRVESLVELSAQSRFRRGHGALYDAVACGEIDIEQLAGVITSSWKPSDDGPLKFVIDVSAWHRPYAECSAQRHHCNTSCACGNRSGTVAGWPYSMCAGLEWGRSSWSAPLDARRLDLADDATEVTAAQVADVIARCASAGLLRGRPAPLFVVDSGYDLTRLTYLTGQAGMNLQVLGRIRCNRVYYGDPGPRSAETMGRPAKHGERFDIADPATWHGPDQRIERASARYGRVTVSAWHGLHQKLGRQAAWLDHPGELPNVAGTVIRIQVEHLPGDRDPGDLWLWHHAPNGTSFDLDLLWMAYLRRFDIEHTFRFFKQSLGWTSPQIATPAQGDRWTWLILIAYTQLRQARELGTELRRPWQRPLRPDKLPTPGQVRRDFPPWPGKSALPPESRNPPPQAQAARKAPRDLPDPPPRRQEHRQTGQEEAGTSTPTIMIG